MRDNDQYTLPSFYTITFGKKSFRYYGPKLWSNIPTEIKNKVSLSTFKLGITAWLDSIDNLTNIHFL